MDPFKVFIVEDDPWFGEILEYHLSLNQDCIISRFQNGKDCLSHMHQKPDLITVDYTLPDFTGETLYEKIRETDKQVPVIIISGQEQVAVAVKLLKLGVADYLVKDEHTQSLLWNAVMRLRETDQLRREVETLKEELAQRFSFEKSIKGQSPALQKIFQLMDKAARTGINVSITGETGTGKELVAKAIHFNSGRRKNHFVSVNMAAIPRELVESELFGHEKGSFAGAIARKTGRFEEANGGTIFLDEVGCLDPAMQSKLLRVLQEREVYRIGGNEQVKLDIRLIVATHKNLAEETKKGNFREDLYYRIMGLPIELPPLRERGNDILVLSRFFLNEFTEQNKMEYIGLSPDAMEKLMHYNYPGNVRELKAIIELAAVLCNGPEIKPDDISFSTAGAEDAFIQEQKTLRQYTCNIIMQFLKKYDYNVIAVARRLNVGKSTIYKMIQTGEIVMDAGSAV